MNKVIEKSVKSGVDVKKELEIELVKKLDELQFNIYLTNPIEFESDVRISYESIKKSIGFTLVPERYMQYLRKVISFTNFIRISE